MRGADREDTCSKLTGDQAEGWGRRVQPLNHPEIFTPTPLGFGQIDDLVDLGRRAGTELPYVVVSRATSLNGPFAFCDFETRQNAKCWSGELRDVSCT